MGTAGLIQIKRRMKSIESTRKITKAMALVATSKLRKVRKRLSCAMTYSEINNELLNKVVSVMPEDTESIYLSNKFKSPKLYIVINSNMGLCGGFNNNVVVYLNETIGATKENVKIISVGFKGGSYLNKFGFEATKVYNEISDIPTNEEIGTIYKNVKAMYDNGEVSEVNIVYTEFKSPIKQVVDIVRIFPIKYDKREPISCIMEPDINHVFENCMELYIKSEIMKCMISSKVSEQSSRRIAMENATDSANEILKNLNIKFNRIRQGIITQEIAEIVGGAEAQR